MNTKYKIAYIDDQSFAIPQVIGAIPEGTNYDFVYYNRVSDIREYDFDLVILDYYLDLDGLKGSDILSRLDGSIVISFSTAASKNALMEELGVFASALKLQGQNENSELTKAMKKYFSGE